MNVKITKGRSADLWRLGFSGALLTTGLLVDEHITAAPSVIANQTPAPPLTTQWQQEQPSSMDVFIPAGGAPEAQLPDIFRYGPLQIRPHADYRFMYGNGIQATPGDQEMTIVQEFSPGILVDIGKHWAIDYTPTLRFYSSDKFKDGVDHSVALTGGTYVNDWLFGFSHGSQFTTAPLAETGAETEQTAHVTGLTASHELNSRISTDLGLSQQINSVSGFQDSYTWSTLDWLNYQFWPRLNVGLGAGGGYVKVSDNSNVRGGDNLDQTFEEIEARINWRLTEKISFQVTGGLEDRQFQTGASDSLSPIFSATIQYQPFKSTQIALIASRSVSSSDYYVAAQQTESTSVGINVNQRLIRNFSLDFGVTYGQTDFSSAVTGLPAASANRTDNQTAFNVRLSRPFFKRATWALFYQYNDNRSSQAGMSFQSNQTGFEISYAF